MDKHTLAPLDIFDTSLSSLRNLWSDSPETYAMVVRAVSCHEELVQCLKEVVEDIPRINRKEYYRQAIAKAAGK